MRMASSIICSTGMYLLLIICPLFFCLRYLCVGQKSRKSSGVHQCRPRILLFWNLVTILVKVIVPKIFCLLARCVILLYSMIAWRGFWIWFPLDLSCTMILFSMCIYRSCLKLLWFWNCWELTHLNFTLIAGVTSLAFLGIKTYKLDVIPQSFLCDLKEF